MKTARINYVGSTDIEYTEIRPIREGLNNGKSTESITSSGFLLDINLTFPPPVCLPLYLCLHSRSEINMLLTPRAVCLYGVSSQQHGDLAPLVEQPSPSPSLLSKPSSRPNQSVILAGLGVTGAKVVTCRKDREYRSTQGAGYRPGSSTLIGQDIRDTVLSLVHKDI